MKAFINLLPLGKMLSALELRQFGAAEILVNLPKLTLIIV